MTEPVNPRYPGTEHTSEGYDPAPASSSFSPSTQILGTAIRVLAAGLTLAAAVKMGITVQEDIFGVSGQRATVRLPDKAVHFTASIYFVVANVTVFAYSLWSTPMSVGRSVVLGILQLVPIGDLMMVALLFSCNGTIVALAGIQKTGKYEARWDQFCDSYDSFCGHIKVSVLLSLVAAAAYLMLFIVSMMNLHKRPHFF